MARLVVDACASLHLKQLGALDLLGTMHERGLVLIAPSGVHGEMVAMSLSEWTLRVGVERASISRREMAASRSTTASTS